MKLLGRFIGILAIVALATFIFVGFFNAFMVTAWRTEDRMFSTQVHPHR